MMVSERRLWTRYQLSLPQTMTSTSVACKELKSYIILDLEAVCHMLGRIKSDLLGLSAVSSAGFL